MLTRSTCASCTRTIIAAMEKIEKRTTLPAVSTTSGDEACFSAWKPEQKVESRYQHRSALKLTDASKISTTTRGPCAP